MTTTTTRATTPKTRPAGPATIGQARVYQLWADAIRASYAACAALDALSDGIDGGPDDGDIGLDQRTENDIHLAAAHLAGVLRIGVQSRLDTADMHEEVVYLLGRLDVPGRFFNASPAGEFMRSKVVARVRERLGDLVPDPATA